MALPTHEGVGPYQSGIDDITLQWPTHQTNDVALVILESNGAVTVPSGWASTADSPQAGTFTTATAFWKRAASGAEADVAIADAGNHVGGRIHIFRGCPTTGNPWDVTSGGFSDSGNTVITIPGDTTTVPDCLIVLIGTYATDTSTGQSTNNWANADLANITQRSDNATSSGNGGGVAVATGEKATAGAYGNTTLTLSASTTRAYMSIALKGASGVVGTAAITLPHLTSASAATVRVAAASAFTLPAVTSTGAAAVRVAGASTITLPSLTSAAAATVRVSGAGALTLPQLIAATAGAVRVQGGAALTLPALSLSGASAVRVRGAAALALPLLVVRATNVEPRVGSAAITLPMLRMFGGYFTFEYAFSLSPLLDAALSVEPLMHAGLSITPLFDGDLTITED